MLTLQARADERLYRKVNRLPAELERARTRVRHLETEALRLGLRDLVEARA